jgi:hypothetical protein
MYDDTDDTFPSRVSPPVTNGPLHEAVDVDRFVSDGRGIQRFLGGTCNASRVPTLSELWLCNQM